MMKHSYPPHHHNQQQQQRDYQSTLSSPKVTSPPRPSNASIKSLNHQYVLTNENLNFNFDEIRQELANLGVTGLSEDQLACLKHDLDLIISQEKQALRYCLLSSSESKNDRRFKDDDDDRHHDGDSYSNDDNAEDGDDDDKKNNTIDNEKKKSVCCSSLTSLSSSPSCFSITSEEFSNCDENAGDNHTSNNNNNNSNNNYGDENINNVRRNDISSKKQIVPKLSLMHKTTNQQSIENKNFVKYRQLMKMNNQNDHSNSALLNENATKSSSSSLIRKSQKLTKFNNRNSIDFLSPKYTNLPGNAKTVGTDNYNKKLIDSNHHLYENETKHSTTDPQLATDILSSTMYDMRTSYLLSNDDVKDDEDNDADVVVEGDIDKENDDSGTAPPPRPLPPTSLSSKAFLDDANCRKRHQQQQRQRQEQSHRTNIGQKYHHHNHYHHHQHQHHLHQEEQNQFQQTVDAQYHHHHHHDKSTVQPIHPESRVIKFKPIILHNPLSVSSSQQTSSMTVAPASCWSSQSYSDLPQSASTTTTIQDKYSTLMNPIDRRNSAVQCSYTGDNICKKSVKQPIQSSHKGEEDKAAEEEEAMIRTKKTIHRNILPNTEDCDQYSGVIENYILEQSRGIKHDPSHEVLLAPVFVKSTATTPTTTATTPLTNKISHPSTQTSKDPLSKVKTFYQRYQQSQNPNHNHQFRQELQSKFASTPQGQYVPVINAGTKKPSTSNSLTRGEDDDDNDDNISPSTTTTTTNTRNKLTSRKIDPLMSSLPTKRNISSATSRRSARFLDDPVDQVHSLPQRPKSSCLQYYQKPNSLQQNFYDTQSAYSRNSQRSGSSSVVTRRRQDPVARYHAYQRSWLLHSTPGENARRVLRWNIKTAMMHREVPLLQRNSAEVARLLGPYASAYLEEERKRRIKALKLDYVPPTSRRYDALRQSIRSLMTNPS